MTHEELDKRYSVNPVPTATPEATIVRLRDIFAASPDLSKMTVECSAQLARVVDAYMARQPNIAIPIHDTLDEATAQMRALGHDSMADNLQLLASAYNIQSVATGAVVYRLTKRVAMLRLIAIFTVCVMVGAAVMLLR